MFRYGQAQTCKVLEVLRVNDYGFLQKDKMSLVGSISSKATNLYPYKIRIYLSQSFGFRRFGRGSYC